MINKLSELISLSRELADFIRGAVNATGYKGDRFNHAYYASVIQDAEKELQKIKLEKEKGNGDSIK